jgi:hypothetical protein
MKRILIILLAVFTTAILSNAQERTPGPDKVGKNASRATVAVQELDGTTLTVNDLVEAILGPGITYSNVNFIGTQAPAVPASAGTFSNGTGAGMEVDEGIVLSSGYIVNAPGPNINDGITGTLNLAGDADLDLLVGGGTQDATVLEFDFIPENNTVYIEYVFASDEYNEYVGSTFNDVFAFFVNGTNIALIPSTVIPVAINNVNNGNPFGSVCNYCQYYVNNDINDGGPFFDFEADGFTVKFIGEATVTPDETNNIKIAIADRGDSSLDSWVFIKAESFSTNPPGVPVSPWALFIGLGLIIVFTLIRYRKLS